MVDLSRMPNDLDLPFKPIGKAEAVIRENEMGRLRDIKGLQMSYCKEGDNGNV